MPDPAADHRDNTPAAPVTFGAVPSGFFAVWRRAIGAAVGIPARVGRSMSRVARSWWSQWRGALEYHRNAAAPWETAESASREAAAALGARGFMFGMIALAIVTASARNVWGPGVVAAGGEILWAGVRFIIIALLMPRGAIGRSRLSVAFLAGLFPYAIGVTWLLRLVALGASAVLTLRGMRGAGVSESDSRVAVGWAFGGQAAVLAAGWIVRAIVALVAMR